MAVQVATRESLPKRLSTFYTDVMAEMRKVAWPDRAQIQQATIGIIAIVLFVGAVIALLDVAIQQVFVRGLPALFSGR
jgi:preprotein translocase subunit SecE